MPKNDNNVKLSRKKFLIYNLKYVQTVKFMLQSKRKIGEFTMDLEENIMSDENSTDSYYQICELIDEISYRNPSIDKEKFSKLKSYYQGDTRSIAEIKAEIDQYLMEMDEKEEEKEFGPPEKAEAEEDAPEEILEGNEEKEEPKKPEDNSSEEGTTPEDSEEEYEDTEAKEVSTSQSSSNSSESETSEVAEEPEIYEGLDVYQTPEQAAEPQQPEIYEGLLDAYKIPGIDPESYQSERSSELGDMFNSY